MNSKEIKAAIERLRSQYEKGLGYSLDDVACAFLGESYGMRVALSSKFRDVLIALLEQADPSTHMGLPVDADGVPFRVGDEVVNKAGSAVHKIVAIGGPTGRTLWLADEPYICHPTDYFTWECYECRHYHKPTIEEILDELEGLRGTGDYEAVVTRTKELASQLRELIQDE